MIVMILISILVGIIGMLLWIIETLLKKNNKLEKYKKAKEDALSLEWMNCFSGATENDLKEAADRMSGKRKD